MIHYTIVMNTLSPRLQSLFENRMRYLPEITARALTSIDWSSKLITIGKKYGVHVDEMEDFQEVVLNSMIGLSAPDQFEQQLLLALAVSPTTLTSIIHDINDQIFEPIHDFVVNQGKSPDPLQQAGLIVEKTEPIVTPVVEIPIQSQPQPPAAPTLEAPTLIIPETKTEAPSDHTEKKPIISGDFSNFFIT